MSGRHVLRLFLVLVLVLIVQTTIALDLHIAGAHPDLMLLLPIAAGVVGGAELGAGLGFVAGFVADLFLPTPFGLSALTFTIVGFAVGYVVHSPSENRNAPALLVPLVALAASAAGVMLYAVLGAILGQPQMLKVDLAAVVTVVAVVNALLVVPATRLVGWAVDQPTHRRRSRGRLMDRQLREVR